MKKGLQDPKLAGGDTVAVQARAQPRLHRVGCPRQINEHIQRPPRLAIAFKMCRHYGLTINSLTSNDWMQAHQHSIHTRKRSSDPAKQNYLWLLRRTQQNFADETLRRLRHH